MTDDEPVVISPNYVNNRSIGRPWNPTWLCVILRHIHFLNGGGDMPNAPMHSEVATFYALLTGVDPSLITCRRYLRILYNRHAVVHPETKVFLGIVMGAQCDVYAEHRHKLPDYIRYREMEDSPLMLDLFRTQTMVHCYLMTSMLEFVEKFLILGVLNDGERSLAQEFAIGVLCLKTTKKRCTSIFEKLGLDTSQAESLYEEFRARGRIGNGSKSGFVMCYSNVFKRIIPFPIPRRFLEKEVFRQLSGYALDAAKLFARKASLQKRAASASGALAEDSVRPSTPVASEQQHPLPLEPPVIPPAPNAAFPEPSGSPAKRQGDPMLFSKEVMEMVRAGMIDSSTALQLIQAHAKDMAIQ